MATAGADKLLGAARSGRRLTGEEAVRLYRQADLLELGRAAQAVRFRRVPERRVTYLIDRNINYTNVCVTGCQFCAFYRPAAEHPEAYTLSRADFSRKVEELLEVGGTRVLMQGGHHPALRLAWYEDLLRWLGATYPEVEIDAFSPPEIDHIARLEGMTVPQVLARLQAAGLAGLPGGGAEILDDEVRARISPKKQSTAGWLDSMRAAHALGLVTTATMVIGCGETVEQRAGHLQRVRDLQDESLSAHGRGFVAFIAWTLHVDNTPLGRGKSQDEYGASAQEYLRNVAVARLFLDNFAHVQASWPTQGLRLAEVALEFGCDDFGSTMLEENVVSAAGTSRRQVEEILIQRHIHGAGYTPAQRDSCYNVLRQVECVPEPAAPRRAGT